VPAISATSDEVDYLHDITAGERMRREFFAIAENCAVVLHDNQSRIYFERTEQLR
jgi:hypothetical protein